MLFLTRAANVKSIPAMSVQSREQEETSRWLFVKRLLAVTSTYVKAFLYQNTVVGGRNSITQAGFKSESLIVVMTKCSTDL